MHTRFQKSQTKKTFRTRVEAAKLLIWLLLNECHQKLTALLVIQHPDLLEEIQSHHMTLKQLDWPDLDDREPLHTDQKLRLYESQN